MTLDQAFDGFKSTLEIDQATQDAISQKEKLIRETLQREWRGCEVSLSGSYGRKTKIRPLKDVDLFVVLPESYPEPAKIRIDAKTFALQRYADIQRIFPRESIRPQTHSIGLTFKDGPQGQSLRFDLVFAYKRNGGGYFIANRVENVWRFTNPNKQKEFVKEQDRKLQQQGVPIVKMIKTWNQHKQLRLKSYHVETLLLRELKPGLGGYCRGVVQAFEVLSKKLQERCGDPGDSGSIVNDYESAETPRTAAAAAGQAKEALQTLLLSTAKELDTESLNRLKKLFGPSFP